MDVWSSDKRLKNMDNNLHEQRQVVQFVSNTLHPNFHFEPCSSNSFGHKNHLSTCGNGLINHLVAKDSK